MILKRIDPMSAGKISGVLYAIMGLFSGVIMSLVALIGVAMKPPEAPAWFGGLFGVGAIVVLPVLYGFMGFVMALIGAALYNAMASLVGGVQVDLE
jgi:hypothetical protein